jgi:hypothetical protein
MVDAPCDSVTVDFLFCFVSKYNFFLNFAYPINRFTHAPPLVNLFPIGC